VNRAVGDGSRAEGSLPLAQIGAFSAFGVALAITFVLNPWESSKTAPAAPTTARLPGATLPGRGATRPSVSEATGKTVELPRSSATSTPPDAALPAALARVELANVEGIVVDAEGARVPGARVRAVPIRDGGAEGQPVAVVADARGQFALHVTAGLVDFRVDAEGFASAEHTTDLSDTVTNHEVLRLARASSLEVVVRSKKGKPIAATATLELAGPPGGDPSSGVFVWDKIGEGVHSLRVESPGWVTHVESVPVLGGTPKRVEVTLLGAATVRGTVHLTDGTPASGAQLWRRPGERSEKLDWSDTLNDAGVFELGGLAPGRLDLIARSEDGALFARRALDLEEARGRRSTSSSAPRPSSAGWSATPTARRSPATASRSAAT
jgi:hypothetical protein